MTSEGPVRAALRRDVLVARLRRQLRRLNIGRVVLAGAVVSTGVVLIVTIGIAGPTDAESPVDDDPFAVPQLDPEPHNTVPGDAAPAPVDRPHTSDIAELEEWSQQYSEVTEVPARALRGYGLAEMWMRNEAPDCGLSWTVLAGIGRVESRHGTIGGGHIDADGNTSERIIGPPLDGSDGTRHVPDTDGGALDGDAAFDRAVGPMQFIPQTWGSWRARAARDGADPDPHHIDDAAVTAARYLCARGEDLTSPRGWWRAVLAYNQSQSYARDVYSGAQAYAQRSRNVTDAQR